VIIVHTIPTERVICWEGGHMGTCLGTRDSPDSQLPDIVMRSKLAELSPPHALPHALPYSRIVRFP
jgi:hypothetical protein